MPATPPLRLSPTSVAHSHINHPLSPRPHPIHLTPLPPCTLRLLKLSLFLRVLRLSMQSSTSYLLAKICICATYPGTTRYLLPSLSLLPLHHPRCLRSGFALLANDSGLVDASRKAMLCLGKMTAMVVG